MSDQVTPATPTRESRANWCWTCGRRRGLSVQRPSWEMRCPTAVPRTDSADDKPAQITNDLIVNACVYRNGGTAEETHLCDDCLRIGLRAIKLHVDESLESLEAGRDKDVELAALTERLARLQHRYQQVCYAHNRMQDRLRAVSAMVNSKRSEDSAHLEAARWEIARGHVAPVF